VLQTVRHRFEHQRK